MPKNSRVFVTKILYFFRVLKKKQSFPFKQVFFSPSLTDVATSESRDRSRIIDTDPSQKKLEPIKITS